MNSRAAAACPLDMDNRAIAELTVTELEELIKRTIKASVTEVMLEFAIEADVEAQMVYEAEINDMLRGEMQGYGALAAARPSSRHNLDD